MTQPASSRLRVKAWRGLGFERSGSPAARGYVAIYLALALPLLIALCFLTGPFQVNDEPEHFFRAVGVSHGEFMPVVSPKKDSAGGFIEAGAVELGHRYGYGTHDLKKNYTFTTHDVVRSDFAQTDGTKKYEPYSNTAIYFPIAHLLPGVCVYLARSLGARPLEWFYIGRLANALAAAAISALAIYWLENLGLFGLVFCLLPMNLYEQASLSADALVIPF